MKKMDKQRECWSEIFSSSGHPLCLNSLCKLIEQALCVILKKMDKQRECSVELLVVYKCVWTACVNKLNKLCVL